MVSTMWQLVSMHLQPRHRYHAQKAAALRACRLLRGGAVRLCSTSALLLPQPVSKIWRRYLLDRACMQPHYIYDDYDAPPNSWWWASATPHRRSHISARLTPDGNRYARCGGRWLCLLQAGRLAIHQQAWGPWVRRLHFSYLSDSQVRLYHSAQTNIYTK